MQTINNRMTETQIADLFSLAVQLQVKAEESDDRDTAILAYSIQNACSNLTESRSEFRSADATIHNLELKITDLAVQLANAESKCRELAAENAGLKNPENWLSQSDYGYEASEVATQNGATEDESLRAGMIAIINRIGTPATDAFLAEVRAQGLERLAKAWYAIANETASGISISESSRLKYRQRADDVADFANKIRQEAAQ
ncbi:hypothetical protein ACHH1T_23980 [Citrobacter freundii complex sp. 2024EL-00238]|uniref:hypothetical protein n=1 Tax=Citrobacter TaxID=544 RepID=UPI0004D7746F|nr:MULTISPECIES: hypothetical protein [Citrobacter]KEL77323.1 hypothetical protein AB07_4710 [Citrobacter freundii]MDM3187675.1 hypothetical protein [Citrobacter sp. Cf101]